MEIENNDGRAREDEESASIPETPYRLKSVLIRTLKRTENIVPVIYSMPFSIVES